MITVRNRISHRGGGVSYRIGAYLFALALAGTAHAYTTDPVDGHRIFRFTPDSAEFTTFSTTWNNNTAYYFHDGDVFEFEESDAPYVFPRSNAQGKHPHIIFRGVKADGSPADPARVVFMPDSDSADYNIRGGVTNVFENITFSNMPIYVQCDFNAISNCVFMGMQKRAAVYGQFAVNASYEHPGWSAWATDCRFEDASHSSVGAAMSLYEFAATNCVFAGNINNNGSVGGGGAIGTVGNLSCCNCIFANNRTTGMYGGAIHLTNTGTVALDRCVFTNNCANQTFNRNDSCGGGALSVVAAVSGYIRNCIFVGNYITTEIGKNSYDGGAIRIRHASASISIENCTFANNTITVGGTNKDVGGALAATQGTVGVTNCIFYANHGMLGTTSWKTSHLSVPDWSLVANCLEANFEEGGTTYDFSSIDTDGTPSTHIVNGVNGNKVGDYDPKFTDAANGDYTLQKNSDCRDAGSLLAWMDSSSLDLAGESRVVGDAPDMGCYEWFSDTVGLSIIVR